MSYSQGNISYPANDHATRQPMSPDAANLSRYPWVQICLREFCMAWLLPVLWATSKGFRASLKNENVFQEWRVARVVKRFADRSVSIAAQAKLRLAMVKMMWQLWPHENDKPGLTDTFARVLNMFGYSRPVARPTRFYIIAMNLLRDTFVLEVALRIGCWLVHFGMRDTVLYVAFVSRMDRYVRMVAKASWRMTYKRAAFSKALEHIQQQPTSFGLWVFDMHQMPMVKVGDPVWELLMLFKDAKQHAALFDECLSIFWCSVMLMMSFFLSYYRCQRKALSWQRREQRWSMERFLYSSGAAAMEQVVII